MTNERRAEIEDDCNAAIKAETVLPYNVDFYSPHSAGLILCPYKGRLKRHDNGREARVDDVQARFVQCAGIKKENGVVQKIGHYATNNPHAVLGLLKRMFIEKDIIDHEEFEELIVPTSERLRIERERSLSTRNQLAAYLEDKKRSDKELAELRKQMAALSAASARKGTGAPASE